jgi:hypothetical protein
MEKMKNTTVIHQYLFPESIIYAYNLDETKTPGGAI